VIYRTLIFLCLFAPKLTFAQANVLEGHIRDTLKNPVQSAHIIINEVVRSVSDSSGSFRITDLSIGNRLIISHLSYDTLSYIITQNDFQGLKEFFLRPTSKLLEEVTISKGAEHDRNEAGLITLKPVGIESVQSPFGDFSSVLTTLPGVSANNELTASYRVRGGNFDENLIYVNDIPVYRPQLISAGQQEGLSFVHMDMVREVKFSAGGWQSKYGDKLSSVLNVNYKDPNALEGKLIAGLLGGSLYFGYGNPTGKFSLVSGIRHKNARYLLNTFDTKGEYIPQFTDVQGLLRYNISSDRLNRLSILFNTAQNKYEVIPETRETEFGAFGGGTFRFLVGFDGKELLNYTLSQGGIKWDYSINPGWINQLIASGVYSREREISDLESGYRLCDVNTNIGSTNFNECVVIRGLGTQYDYARNNLRVGMLNIENRQSIKLNESNDFEWGISYAYKEIRNKFNEYEFLDSADYVQITEQILNDEEIRVNALEAFFQNETSISGKHAFNYGVRLNFQNLNNNLLISPRLGYSFNPKWRRDIIFRLAAGVYQQQPFLREMIDFNSNFNRKIKPQSSLHIIAGADYNFTWWSRPFKLLSEAYYKYLWNINPYDVDNVRIRYYADNPGEGKVSGVDLRLSGEFIPGTESWFSLSFLSAQENIDGDTRGFIRRPSDQRISMSIVFQDHLPNDPSLKIFLAFAFGSGFPFGPPNDFENRNIFRGEEYRRVDLGLSKSFKLPDKINFDELALRIEILNLLGTANTISYSWIEDFNGRNFGVPNNLSARFFNVKIEAKL